MPAIITGKVFNDLHHTGTYHPKYPGIAHALIMLECPDHTLLITQTDNQGFYIFYNLTLPGSYTILEAVSVSDTDTLPTILEHPLGLNGSTTVRKYSFALTLEDIEQNTSFDYFNFGHDFSLPFQNAHLAYSINPSNHALYTLNLITGESLLLTKLPSKENFILLGFNTLDYYLYGYILDTGDIFRLSLDGSLVCYSIKDLPHKHFTAGDIDDKGHLYLYETSDKYFYVIDVNSNSPTYMHVLDPTGFPTNSLAISNWCFNPADHHFYGIDTKGHVLRLNLHNYKSEYLATTGTPSVSPHSILSDYSGTLYCLFDKINSIYQIKLSTQSALAEVFAPLTVSSLSHTVRCPHSPLYITLGSAPDLSTSNSCGNYTTLLAHNGPRHGKTNILFFGEELDTDFSLVTIPSVCLTDSQYTLTLPITNHTGKEAYLYAWLDFNRNGLFETSESITPLVIPSTLSGVSSISIEFTAPSKSNITLGETYIRLRLTTALLTLDSTFVEDTRSLGPAPDGHILDLPLSITALPPTGDTICTIGEVDHEIQGSCSSQDPCQGSLEYTLSTPATHGIASVHPYSGKWSYKPFKQFVGKDTFNIYVTSSVSQLSTSIPVSVDIQNISLSISTKSNNTEFLVGDILTYTTHLENTGTLLVDDVIYTHPLPLGTSFITNSVSINGLKDRNANPEYGINLHKLPPGEICTVSFQILLTAPSPQFSSHGFAQASYTITSTNKPSFLTTEGNLVIGNIKSPNLTLDLQSNVTEAFVEDYIQYTAQITNTGDLPLDHIKLTLTLPPELNYHGHLSLDHTSTNGNLCSGYFINALAPNDTSTLQFMVKISDAPIDHIVHSTLFASCDYNLNGEIRTLKDLSVQTSLEIHTPQLELTKSFNKQAISLGETFNCILKATNNSPFLVEDVTITDYLPQEVQVLELYCQGKPLLNTLDTGLSIGKISPNSSTDLTLKLQLTSIPTEKELTPSHATALFKLAIAKDASNKIFESQTPSLPPLLISDAALTLQKSVSTLEASVGETVTYYIVLTNAGTISLDQITLRDLLCPELKFVPNSVMLNGKSLPQVALMSGITLPALAIGETVKISFEALILSKGSGVLENICSAYYTYRPHLSTYTKSGSINSNPCKLTIRQAHLNLSGHVNQTTAFLNDELEYTLKLTNDGDMDIFNILLTTQLNGGELIDGTFCINGLIVNSIDLSTAINVGMIQKNQSTYITYKAKVIGHCHYEDSLTHITVADFSYATTDHCIKYDQTEAFDLSIELALSTFKHLSLDNFLDLPSDRPDMEMINTIGGQISLLKDYIISSPEGISYEGQRLSGQKLILHALLELTVEYVANDLEQSIHSVYYTVPFSTFIILPKECPTHAPMHIDATLENISFKVLSNRSFFANSSLLLIARIK